MRADHCSDCNVCVEKVDHHCPWSSKCIGKGNMNAFSAFLFSWLFQFIGSFVGALFVFGYDPNADNGIIGAVAKSRH